MRTLPLSLSLLAALSASCRESEPAAAPAAAPSAQGGTRALCLAAAPATPSSGAIDAELAENRGRVERNPKDTDALVLLGRSWIQKARNSADPGYYLHADACAQEALALKPGLNIALNLRALVLLNGHRFAEARDLAQQMLVTDPEDGMALGSLADALLELGDVDGAAAAAQRMVDAKPNLPSYARASYLMWLRNDVPGALESIRLAYDAGRGGKDKEPVAFVLTEAAHIFRRRGDRVGALAGYDKALEQKPDYAPALVGKARCLLAEGKAQQALPLLRDALARHQLVETAWLIGEAELLMGDAAKAKAAFAQARQIGERTDQRMLALMLASRNEGGAADIDAAAKAIAQDATERGGIYGDDVKALVAFRKGELAEARALADKAVALGTPDPRLRVHHAVIHGDKRALAEALQEGGADDVLLLPLARELEK